MSAGEGFSILHTQNSLAGEKPKVVKTAKSSLGSAARKKLGDISNLPQRPQSLVQHEKEQFVPNFTAEYIEQLQKENAALVKLLAERNKIVELSGFELQKLRVSLQKMQQQNFQLAQANSQMLAELNSGKDRLKGLQHELGCRNGLLKARELELEETAKLRAYQEMDNQAGSSKSEEHRESSEPDRDENKQCNKNKRQQSKSLSLATVKQNQLKEKTGKKSVRRQSARFKSDEPERTEDKFEVGASTSEEARESPEPERDDKRQKSKRLEPSTLRQVQLREKPGNKRVSLRRQSARFKSEEPEDTEDKFEADNAELPECPLYDHHQIQEDAPASMHSSALKNEACNSSPNGDDAKALRTTLRQVQLSEKPGNKRVSLRRQSARFKSEEPEDTEDKFEADNAELPEYPLYDHHQIQEDAPASMHSSALKNEACNSSLNGDDAKALRRPSIGRPSRLASTKVQSYKEIPLNVKMRRNE